MSNVLEYHQALGLVPLQELDTKCLALKKQQSLDQVKVDVDTYYYIPGIIMNLFCFPEANAAETRVHVSIQHRPPSSELAAQAPPHGGAV